MHIDAVKRFGIAALAAVLGGLGCAPEVLVVAQPVPGKPGFPGAGESGAAALVGGQVVCFYAPDLDDEPAAAVEYAIEAVDEGSLVHARLTFSPRFVDNTYGAGSIGWEAKKKGHTFEDLYKSDHAEWIFTSAAGEEVLRFKQDYLSESPAAPSGYESLLLGGDGELVAGSAAAIHRGRTSIERNLNERGYPSYTIDSPATGASYEPPANAPEWDYRVVYEVWVDEAAFGAAGFGAANLESVHASPSKLDASTLEVTPGPCPAGWVAQ